MRVGAATLCLLKQAPRRVERTQVPIQNRGIDGTPRDHGNGGAKLGDGVRLVQPVGRVAHGPRERDLPCLMHDAEPCLHGYAGVLPGNIVYGGEGHRSARIAKRADARHHPAMGQRECGLYGPERRVVEQVRGSDYRAREPVGVVGAGHWGQVEPRAHRPPPRRRASRLTISGRGRPGAGRPSPDV